MKIPLPSRSLQIYLVRQAKARINQKAIKCLIVWHQQAQRVQGKERSFGEQSERREHQSHLHLNSILILHQDLFSELWTFVSPFGFPMAPPRKSGKHHTYPQPHLFPFLCVCPINGPPNVQLPSLDYSIPFFLPPTSGQQTGPCKHLSILFTLLHLTITTSVPASSPWCLGTYNIYPIGPQIQPHSLPMQYPHCSHGHFLPHNLSKSSY